LQIWSRDPDRDHAHIKDCLIKTFLAHGTGKLYSKFGKVQYGDGCWVSLTVDFGAS